MIEKPTLCVVMDPIGSIVPEKDTTLAILLEAQKKGFELYYLEIKDLYLQFGMAFGNCRTLTLYNSTASNAWYQLSPIVQRPLDQFDIILMRKDPPVDMQYIYATYILERAEQNGTLVVNKPQSLRDANEKVFATWFPQCMVPTLISSSKSDLLHFIAEHPQVVLKPLAGMGGKNIVKTERLDPNLNVLIDLLTKDGQEYIMVQQFIESIFNTGDKRILLIEGEPLPFALARIPANHDFRGNLAAGGKGVGVELTERDLWICHQIGDLLREKGLFFVGIDVIGDYLTEINITSPTCVRELEKAFEVNLAEEVLNKLLAKLEG